jgi:archaellum component FlaG (FlaF/FlaG flagellin family)
LTQLEIDFSSDNQKHTHTITNPTEIVINKVGAQVGHSVKLYVKSDGTNKPFWDSDDVVVTFDNYLNQPNVWNRFYFEWGADNKAIVQIINT